MKLTNKLMLKVEKDVGSEIWSRKNQTASTQRERKHCCPVIQQLHATMTKSSSSSSIPLTTCFGVSASHWSKVHRPSCWLLFFTTRRHGSCCGSGGRRIFCLYFGRHLIATTVVYQFFGHHDWGGHRGVLAVSRVKRPVEGTHVRRGLRTNVEVTSHLEEVTERRGSIDVDIERLQRRRRRRPS